MADASGSRKKDSAPRTPSGRKKTSARKSTSKSTTSGTRKKTTGARKSTTKKTSTKKATTKKSAASTKARAKSKSKAKPKSEAPSGPRKMPRRTPAVGSNASGARLVQCYHCRERFEISIIAESTTCPGCNQRVIVGDVIVDTLRPTRAVQTCGRIVVKEKARVNAQVVEAHEGIEVFGGIAGNVLSGGPVIIGPKAQWNGDCRAPSLEIHPGARIESGRFIVPDDSLGLDDLPGRDRPESERRASKR
jgi:DNA-directed RNA polymerase subunit RPC12/RpoP